MEIKKNLSLQRSSCSRISEIFPSDFAFGNIISEHMLVANYVDGEWINANILPYGPLSLTPATSALQYGQSVFEGIKAFRREDRGISIFRLQKHYERFIRSLQRMNMPAIPEVLFIEGLQMLVDIDREWVPDTDGSALYIRPFMFASDTRFGVRPSTSYQFIIFSGPVPALFTKPIRLKIETKFSRAMEGGTGFAKCSGNYASSFFPTEQAQKEGYDQILWTDSKSHNYIEESGMMNIFFVIDGELITPKKSGTILDGVTRDSFLVLAKQAGIPYNECSLTVTELIAAFEQRRVEEAFGTGTAAVTAPISAIGMHGINYLVPEVKMETSIMWQLRNQLDGIRSGKYPDDFQWNTII